MEPHSEKCIFLVDDSVITLNTGKHALQENYTAVTIPSGEKMMAVLDKILPDLILLDIEMPGMSGYDCIKQLKANPETSEIPVIFLTGRDDPEDELLGLSLGAVDYISKPFSPPLLRKRIELHLLLEEQKKELKAFNDNLMEMVKKRTNEITELQSAVIQWTAEIVEYRDDDTGKHIERVQKYLEILLHAMEQSDKYRDKIAAWDMEALIQSASLHDVGKIKIKDDILLKNGRLTDTEFETMKSHTEYGRLLLESLQSRVTNQTFLDYAKTLAHAHHEKWDGTGYPMRLKGEEIPLHARIMALADVYDALVSARPYKKPFSHEEAVEIIVAGRGTQFDPDIVDLFRTISEQFQHASAPKQEGAAS